MTLQVGLTGNYGSEIDLVTEEFINEGIPVFDADLIIRYLINYDNEIFESIKDKYGNDIYNKNKTYSTLEIFSISKLFDDLLDLTEKKFWKIYNDFLEKNNKYLYIIFKSHILYERGFNDFMDKNINTFIPKNIRVNKIWNNKKISFTEIQSKLDKEISESTKNSNSDFIIHNYHQEFTSLTRQIKKINQSLIVESVKKASSSYNSYGNVFS